MTAWSMHGSKITFYDTNEKKIWLTVLITEGEADISKSIGT